MIEFIKKHYGKIGMSFALVMLVINYFQRQELAELRIKTSIQTESLTGGDIGKAQTIDSLQKRCDSLYDELFPAQIELGRYQVAYEIFMERNPKAAKEYGTIISEETE